MSKFGGIPLDTPSRFGGVPVSTEPSKFELQATEESFEAWLNQHPIEKELRRRKWEEHKKRLEESRQEFYGKTLPRPGNMAIRPATGAEEARLKSLETTRGLSFGSRFQGGMQLAAVESGRGLLRAFGADVATEEFERDVANMAKKAGGFAGGVGQFAFHVPEMALSLMGPAAAGRGVIGYAAGAIKGSGFKAAAPLVLARGYGNAKADKEVWERANGVAVPGAVGELVALGRAGIDLVGLALNRGITTNLSSKLVLQVGTALKSGNIKVAATQLAKAVGISGAEAGTVMAALQLGHNEAKTLYDEDQSPWEGVPEAAAMGMALALAGGFGSVIPSTARAAKVAELRESFRKVGFLTENEAKIIGDDPKAMYEVAKARRDDKLVEVTKVGEKVEVKTSPDLVSWEEKVALDHNEPLISEVRKQRQEGKTVDLFLPPERGVVRPEEFDLVAKQLEDLGTRIKPSEIHEYDADSGIPLTKRALLKGDVEFALAKLRENPTDRTTLNQAKALLETAKRKSLAESIEPPRPEADLVGPRTRVITPLDVLPPNRLRVQVAEAKGKGLLRPPESLTDNLALRGVIERDQTLFLQRIMEIRRGTKLKPTESWALARVLENEFITRMERRLKKVDDTAQGGKTQAARWIKDDKTLSTFEKQPAIEAVSKLFEEIPDKTITSREALARVLDLATDPSKAIPESILKSLETLYAKVVNGTQRESWSGRVRASLRRPLPRTPDEIKAALDTLPPETRGQFAERLAKGENAEVLSKEIRSAQETFLRETTTARVLSYVEKLAKSPKGMEGLEALRRGTVGTVEVPVSGRVTTQTSLADTVDLTPQQKATLETSKGEKFSTLSERHAYFDKAWKEMVEKGVLRSQDADLLRYIFTDMNPEAMSGVRSIEVKERIGRGKTPAEYDRFSRALRIASKARHAGRQTIHFLHEFFHSVHLRVLGVDDLRTVTSIHQKLLGEDVEPLGVYKEVAEGKEWTRAHEIVAEGLESDLLNYDYIDYYARDGWEFFAETGARYTVEQKAPVPILKKFWDKMLFVLGTRLLNLSRTKITSRMVPEEYLRVIDQVFQKDFKAAGKSLTEYEVDKFPGLRALMKAPEIVSKSGKTGKSLVDLKALRKRLGGMTIDQITNLGNEIARSVRRGQIEKGLYNKFLKFRTADDVPAVREVVNRKDPQGKIRQRLDIPIHVAKGVFDPVTFEGFLFSASGSDGTSPLYRIFSGNFEKPFSRAMSHQTSARRFTQKTLAETLGIGVGTMKGELKLSKYLAEELEGGIQRSEAMWAYALSTDEGRAKALLSDGIEARGKSFDVEKSINALSKADKAFVDQMKTFFHDNPAIETAFDTFTLLNGTTPERIKGWFSSRRTPSSDVIPESLGEYSVRLLKEVDSLKTRVEEAGSPFILDGGFLAQFYSVVDRLTTYGEMGKDLYRAERVLANKDFKNDFVARYGEGRYKGLVDYYKYLQGTIGYSQGSLDKFFRYVTKAHAISRIALNVTSAAKQVISLATNLGDDVLDSSALVQATMEGAALSSRIGKEMRENSGIAYMRLAGGRFAENFFVSGQTKLPTILSILQDKSLILQRTMDDRMLRITWRAAEIMAKRQGLKGNAAKEFVTETFERALGRNQSSSIPLYASELEIAALKNPTLLGFLTFKRDLNRAYNVSRRHVVKAVQSPTPENIGKAINAVFWAGVVNSSANVGINSIRSLAFGYGMYEAGKALTEGIKSLAGQVYGLGDIADNIYAVAHPEERRAENYVGFLQSVAMTGWKAVAAVHDAQNVDSEDPTISRGINRGDDKAQREWLKALDGGLSVSSSLLGLPIWMLWYQGKGLYNWEREDYRRMLKFEQEELKLKRDPERNASRLFDLEKVRERINKIHRLRERGLLSKAEAEGEIVRELRGVQD